MAGPVYILGGTQTDFASNWARDDKNLFDLFAHSVREALEVCRLDAKDVEVGHVGNFVAELFAGQGLLGGFFGHADPGFSGMPSGRHEGACASGSLAARAAQARHVNGRKGQGGGARLELIR
ncbi:MAG: thiolase domain-containing protein, partial [Pseudomonadota bacterium]